jgi:hypothetical protein
MSQAQLVKGIIKHHEDPKAAVPIFILENGERMTYLLLDRVKK